MCLDPKAVDYGGSEALFRPIDVHTGEQDDVARLHFRFNWFAAIRGGQAFTQGGVIDG